MPRVLLPIPNNDFDPTEAAVPWKTWHEAGVEVVVATPDGQAANADPIVLSGKGFGIYKPILRTGRRACDAYTHFHAQACNHPRSYQEVDASDFDALFLPGGHAQGMKSYLESECLQGITREFFAAGKLVGAICHGVLVAARTTDKSGKSVLFGRKTTALTEAMELFAWKATRKKLGQYYRTYPETTVEREVSEALESPSDFLPGPKPIFRDSPRNTKRGFVVEDGNYISARYPGDVYSFSRSFLAKLKGSFPQ